MKKFFILTPLLVAAIIGGIVLLILSLRSCGADELVADITLADGVTQKDLHFSAAGLTPGGKDREYTLNLHGKSGKYALEFAFIEEEDGGLREFVNVTLVYGEISEEIALDELFEGKMVKFDCELVKRSAQIRIIFTMPLEVGDAAQGTKTDFIISLTAEQK